MLVPFDTRTLLRVRGHAVTDAKQVLVFSDGSQATLHYVQRAGVYCRERRALSLDEGFVIIHLPELAPELRDELPRTDDRDQAGLILYTLRSRFKTAADFVAAVCALWVAEETTA